ncbi:MAG TPA: T9SS type A sorting domain-containing protein [Flavobacterium sp.]
MKKLLQKNRQIIVCLSLLFLALTPMQMMAQKKILYVQKSGFLPGSGASSSTNDPIIKMFNSDANFALTVLETNAAGTTPPVSLVGYDLVVVQETFGSGDDALKPTGPLAIKNFTIPVIYNKTFALRNGRAVTDSDAVVTQSPSVLSVTVDPLNQTNPLFSGISFASGSTVPIFSAPAYNNGSSTGVTGTIATIDVLNLLDISASNTLLASASTVGINPNQAIVINDIPAGTQLGTAITDVVPSRMIAFSFNYGPTIMGDGTNISSEALTIWRNAAYVLTGQTVPTTLYVNPALGLEENTLASNSVSVSPNPTSGIVTINSTVAVKAITVYDANGKQVSASKTNTVDLSNQAKGIYFAQVQTENGSTTKKIVVE